MSQPLPPPDRGPDCPPAVTLESHALGEETAPTVPAHLTTCEGCRTWVARFSEEADGFLTRRPAAIFVRQVERRLALPPPRARWKFLVPSIAGLTFAALFAVVVARTASVAPRDEVRLKGAPLQVLRVENGGPAPLGEGEPVHAGETVLLAYRASADGVLAVVELDGEGRSSVLFPLGGDAPAPLRVAELDRPLPGSLVLDDAPGPLRWISVWSPAPFDLDAVVEALERGAKTDQVCGGCVVSERVLEKAQR